MHLHFRFILHAKKTGFVVEHDFIMATYLADRVIVFSGTPSLSTTAHSPQSLYNGMNRFLKLLGITFRRDPNNFRPRINKNQSVKVCISFINIRKVSHIFLRDYICEKFIKNCNVYIFAYTYSIHKHTHTHLHIYIHIIISYT